MTSLPPITNCPCRDKRSPSEIPGLLRAHQLLVDEGTRLIAEFRSVPFWRIRKWKNVDERIDAVFRAADLIMDTVDDLMVHL